MVDQDIAFEKIKQIKRCLERISEKTKNNPETLTILDIQDIFVLNIQRAVQSTIDLAAHIISDENLGLPSDMKENFVLLEKNHILSQELSKKLQSMVGFRNLCVHDYSSINVDVLKSILKDHLSDLEEYTKAILKFISSKSVAKE